MYIDYSKVITENFKLFVNETQLEELKATGRKERNYIKAKYHPDVIRLCFNKKAEEIVYISSKYQLKNNVEKAIIANNIVFTNKDFAHILTNGGFNRETLETYLKLLTYLKSKISNDTLDKNDEKYQKSAELFANKLVKYVQNYVGPITPNLIINKINEVISFEPELLKESTKKHTK